MPSNRIKEFYSSDSSDVSGLTRLLQEDITHQLIVYDQNQSDLGRAVDILVEKFYFPEDHAVDLMANLLDADRAVIHIGSFGECRAISIDLANCGYLSLVQPLDYPFELPAD